VCIIRARGLIRLEDLHLFDTRVTGAGLLNLRGLTNLHSVAVDGTQVSQEEARQLERALPAKFVVRW
jgi:hypothetical protein